MRSATARQRYRPCACSRPRASPPRARSDLRRRFLFQIRPSFLEKTAKASLPPRERGAAGATASTRSVGDEARLGHQILVQRVVFLEEFQHVGAGEKNRLQRLLFHVV